MHGESIGKGGSVTPPKPTQSHHTLQLNYAHLREKHNKLRAQNSELREKLAEWESHKSTLQMLHDIKRHLYYQDPWGDDSEPAGKVYKRFMQAEFEYPTLPRKRDELRITKLTAIGAEYVSFAVDEGISKLHEIIAYKDKEADSLWARFDRCTCAVPKASSSDQATQTEAPALITAVADPGSQAEDENVATTAAACSGSEPNTVDKVVSNTLTGPAAVAPASIDRGVQTDVSDIRQDTLDVNGKETFDKSYQLMSSMITDMINDASQALSEVLEISSDNEDDSVVFVGETPASAKPTASHTASSSISPSSEDQSTAEAGVDKRASAGQSPAMPLHTTVPLVSHPVRNVNHQESLPASETINPMPYAASLLPTPATHPSTASASPLSSSTTSAHPGYPFPGWYLGPTPFSSSLIPHFGPMNPQMPVYSYIMPPFPNSVVPSNINVNVNLHLSTDNGGTIQTLSPVHSEDSDTKIPAQATPLQVQPATPTVRPSAPPAPVLPPPAPPAAPPAPGGAAPKAPQQQAPVLRVESFAEQAARVANRWKKRDDGTGLGIGGGLRAALEGSGGGYKKAGTALPAISATTSDHPSPVAVATTAPILESSTGEQSGPSASAAPSCKTSSAAE